MTNVIPLLSSKGYETLWGLSNSNHKAFWDNSSHEGLRHSLEEAITAKGEAPELLYDGEIILNADINPLNDADIQDDTTDAKNAPVIRPALPEITSARAADHRLWASVNCFALLPYAAKRTAVAEAKVGDAVGDEGVQLVEGAFVHQAFQPLASGELAPPVLLVNAVLPAAQPRLAAQGIQFFQLLVNLPLLRRHVGSPVAGMTPARRRATAELYRCVSGGQCK